MIAAPLLVRSVGWLSVASGPGNQPGSPPHPRRAPVSRACAGSAPASPGPAAVSAQLPGGGLVCRPCLRRRARFFCDVENAGAIAEICARLDGLPLAIELVAVRVGQLPPSELLQQLTHRLGLLTAGPLDLPSRQQTLRGAIDWSYALLSPG